MNAIPRRRQRDFFRDDLPDRPYCMRRVDGRPSGRMRILPLHVARRWPYIQINPPWLVVCMTFDIDRPGAAGAWCAAELPEPLASATNRANGHAHLIYALAAPVMTGVDARRRPVNLLAAVEGAMTVRLHADPGYSGLIAKNPLSRAWQNLWSTDPARYELKFLAEFLTDAEIKRHWPRKANRDALSGLGRNVDTFNAARLWSYHAVRDYWPAAGERRRPAFDCWQDAVTNFARSFNADNHVYPMADSECRAIGKSVSKWTWARFNPATFQTIQRKRGVQSGVKRRAANAKRDAAIIEGRLDGASLRELAAAHELTAEGIRYILSRAGLTAGTVK